jgi:hypothetical protein
MSYDVVDLEEMGSDKLKLLLHGAQGHGKTTTALSIAEVCKTVVIDLPGEKGLRSVKQVPYSKNIKVIRATSTDQLTEIFWDAQTANGPFKAADAVVLESASSYAQMAIRKILDVPEDSVRPIGKSLKAMEIQHWGMLLGYMTDLATFWYGLADITSPNPLHVIFTCQSKRVEDEDTGEVRVTLDVSEGSRGPLLANPDYIGYCFVEKGLSQDVTKEAWEYKVRFGPHDTIATKIHEDVAVNSKLVSDRNGVLGGFGPRRLTIPKFCKMMKIPLT